MNFNGSMVCCPGVNSTNCADADLSFYTGKYGSSPVENNFSDLFASCNCTNWYKDTKDVSIFCCGCTVGDNMTLN